MKIGIMSFPHSRSLGCMLQMRALYHAVEQQGHEVEIINYVCDDFIYRRKRKLTFKDVVIAVINKIFIKTPKAAFKKFESALKMFPSDTVSSGEMLKEVSKHFDRIIVGSDQVWNPSLTGNNMNFYLEFCTDDSKKTSYAASFGTLDVCEKDKPRIAELLKRFSLLSVREDRGQEIVENLTGRKAEVVLDPTLLVDAEFLRSLARKSKINKKYVLFYNIKPSPTLLEHARKYAKENNLRLITIGGRIVDHFHPFRYPQFDVGPEEFLGLVDGAECIFTNSFHGMAISIAFHKEFFVEFSTETNSRLVSLARLLELENRVIESKTPAPEKIDYNKTDKILSIHKKHSREFLEKILSTEM